MLNCKNNLKKNRGNEKCKKVIQLKKKLKMESDEVKIINLNRLGDWKKRSTNLRFSSKEREKKCQIFFRILKRFKHLLLNH